MASNPPAAPAASASPSAGAGAVEQVELTVDGRIYTGWTSATVELGLDALAGAFSLTLAERSPADGTGAEPQPWLARAGAAATISIDGTPVITGWIDTVEPLLVGDDHAITLRGRSKTADLIDCSAVQPTSAFTNRTILQIATALAQPFGIAVSLRGNGGQPFRRFTLQPGESVFEAIERAAKMRGLLLVSDPDGGLALVNPQPSGSAMRIEQGRNILQIAARHDVSQRFSRYIVRGQHAGSDELNGREASQVRAEASDPGVVRYRPLVVMAEEQATIASSRTRAQWEATVRAAKSQGADVTVRGWYGEDGQLWTQTRSVELVAPAAYVEGQMMVANLTFSLDDRGGRTTVLGLAFPQAYQPEPVPPEANAARIRNGRGQ